LASLASQGQRFLTLQHQHKVFAMRHFPAGVARALLALFVVAGLVVAGLGDDAAAKGFLATKPEKLPDLVLGTDDTGFGVSQKEYKLETGKAYQLKIISSGKQEYAMKGPDFFTYIWLRKVEAGGLEIKAHTLYELEFENEGEAELFFVPIRPGNYTLSAAGLEERGVVINFVIE
jgi:hypothetical protein